MAGSVVASPTRNRTAPAPGFDRATSTDAAAVFSVLRNVRPNPRLSGILEAESGFNGLADAAAQGTDLVEEQVRQVSEALAGDAEPAEKTEVAPPARNRRTRTG